MLPKRTASRGTSRPSAKRQEEQKPETEKVAENADKKRDLSSIKKPKVKRNKRYRLSKKMIPDYNWTDEGIRQLAEYVKEYPQLYDKRHTDWLNVAVRTQLFTEAGEQQEPPATGDQCKKLYENMRTRVGKIIKKENKRGAGYYERSVRDQEIMDTWSFLTPHIVPSNTIPSEFTISWSGESGTDEDLDDDQNDDLSSAGSHRPVTWEKGAGIGKRSRPSSAEPSNTSSIADNASSVAPAFCVTQTDLSGAVRQMLPKTDSMGHTSHVPGHRKIVHDFACLLEGHMLAIPEDLFHSFEIDCLNLVERFRQRGLAMQQQQQPLLGRLHCSNTDCPDSSSILQHGGTHLTTGSPHKEKRENIY